MSSNVQPADSRSFAAATWRGGWPLERVLFSLAGTIAILSAALAAAVSPWFLLLTAFVGANQLLYAAFGFCGASLILSRFTSLQPACATGEGR